MTKQYLPRAALVCAVLCACEVVETTEPAETSQAEQPGTTLQGTTLQGTTLQGTTLQGTTLQGTSLHMLGFQRGGATLGADALANLRVERGELVAEQNGVALRGAALVGAQLVAQWRSLAVSPPQTVLATYRIADVVPESSAYDPTHTGSTFLYTIEQWVPDTGSWQPACPADADGRRVAIPLTGTWDERGNRIESTSLFTFGCTYGVIAKCYRWGYRPWVTGYGDLTEMHWTCTRLARADYCGNGVSNTHDGTRINVWDNLPAPGPIQKHGGLSPLIPPLGMLFEAGWSTRGAECISHSRWLTLGSLIATSCPDRFIPLSLAGVGCNSVLDVSLLYPSVHLFNESLNLAL